MTTTTMRSILSISLPAEKKKELENRAKKANKTTSAYVMQMFELEKNLISEEELCSMAQQAGQDYKEGKTKKSNSLSDLIK